MYKVGPSLLIQKRPHGQAIVHNCSWTHCWARPFLRARSEHRYQLADIHPPRCYHPSVLRCQNHIFCCWSDLRMRAKRIPLPGNPTGAHRDLSITSKENVLSNVLHKENTMKVADAERRLRLSLIPRQNQTTKTTTAHTTFSTLTRTKRQWRLEKLLIILKKLLHSWWHETLSLAMVY